MISTAAKDMAKYLFAFFKNEICYNFTILGMALSVSSTAELLPVSQERKELKIKAKLRTLMMMADLKSNEKEHQAAGRKGTSFPHSAYSYQPVLVPAAYGL